MKNATYNQAGLKAVRLTSEQLGRVGQHLRNCLANREYRQKYKNSLDNNSKVLIGMMNIETKNYEALISINSEDCSVLEAKEFKNGPLTKTREPIIHVLARYNARIGECRDLINVGVCDETLEAYREDTLERLLTGGRSFEVGPGFVSVFGDDGSLLLRAAKFSCDEWKVATHTKYVFDAAESAARLSLRKTCRAYPDFARACRKAMPRVPTPVKQDWFPLTRV